MPLRINDIAGRCRALLLKHRWAALLLAAFLSINVKLLISTRGYNFDLVSYHMAADCVLDGKSVYASTTRYNYAPPWAYVVGGLHYLGRHDAACDRLPALHFSVAAFLGVVDAAIGLLLAYEFSLAAGLLFLLNPVAFLLTGYHSQFDNLALLLGFLGVICIHRSRNGERQAHLWLGALLLGYSIAVKHVLAFFPLWFLFMRRYGVRDKAVLLFVPYAVAASTFIPYLPDAASRHGIAAHVLRYGANLNNGFATQLLQFFVPVKFLEQALQWVPVVSGLQFFLFAGMLWLGYAVRDEAETHSVLYYCMGMVALSPALSDQSLMIPLAGLCVFYRNTGIVWYTVLAALYLLSSHTNIGGYPSLVAGTREVWNSGSGLPFLYRTADLLRSGGIVGLQPIGVVALVLFFMLKQLKERKA